MRSELTSRKDQAIGVLHLDTEKTWRGGERQVELLLDGLSDSSITNHIAGVKGSAFLKRLSGRVPSLELNFSGWEIFQSIFRLHRYIKKHGIRIIDAHTARAHSVALALGALNQDVKIVVHRRVDYLPGSGLPSRLKYKSSRISRYVAISDAIAQVLVDYGVDSRAVSIVRSGVPSKVFAEIDRDDARRKLCQELNWRQDLPIIANVGYLTPQKGHATLVRALGFMKAHGAEFQAFIAGDGELREPLEALAKSLELENLIFLGVRQDVPSLLRASDIMSMPSNYEGLGTTILDGFLAGLPVAASRVGGIPEIINNGRNGLLSEVGDFEHHGENLLKLVKDVELRHQMALEGRNHVERLFSVDAMVSGNYQVYQDLCSPTSRASAHF